MRVPGHHRAILYEAVQLGAEESMAVRDFRLANFPFRWHRHPELELTLIVRGRGTRLVLDSVEHFAAGDLCFLGADTPHTWYSRPADGTVRSQVIQFLPAAWGAAFLGLPELRSVGRLFAAARRGLAISGPTRRVVRLRMADIFRQNIGSTARIGILLEILAILTDPAHANDLRPLALTALEPSHPKRGDHFIQQVLSRLHQDAQTIPTQQEMAAMLGRKPAAFSRFFQRQMGRTYTSHVNDWRISRACRMLAETDVGITAIALQCGFNNLSNFNRRFKQAKSMTPRAYRALADPEAPVLDSAFLSEAS